MREYSVPARVPADPAATLCDTVLRNAAEAPDHPLLSRPGPQGWQDVSCARFLAEVTELAKGLAARGVAPGDRVGLISKTRYEWTLVDYAIWFAGGITVPIYETSSPEQVAWILSDSGAVACVAETPAHAATVTGVREGLPALRELWTIENGGIEQLGEAGTAFPEAELAERRRGMSGASVATIIYTSGTTGRPKGCELTHANFHELSVNTVAELSEVLSAEGACTLLFLPLAHVFARFVQVLCMTARARLAHTADIANLLGDLASFQPTFVLAVPRVFEKIYNSAEATADSGGKGAVFRSAADTAIAYSRAQQAGSVPISLRLRHALFDRLVYGKIRSRLGGRLAYAVSGGAPLGPRLGHFFHGLGITVLEGWGLTETTAPATVTVPGDLQIGTVGRPLPGVSVAVDSDGELLVRGINVMRGYFANPEATGAALQDGWFRTGDLGEIDEGGHVRITGRKKELIVTASGKNVAPTVLEDRLRAHPLVSQCMVVGDQRPYVACLATLDAEMLPIWLANNGRPPMDLVTAAADPQVRAEIQRAVDKANEAVSKAESIRRFVIVDSDFTEAAGHLTPKSSLRRAAILKDFAPWVEDLYR